MGDDLEGVEDLDARVRSEGQAHSSTECLLGQDRANVDKLWLTASGGPFRTWTKEQLANATIEDALRKAGK